MEEKIENRSKCKKIWFWNIAMASLIFRLILVYFSENLNLSSRPEFSTPVTSLRRLAEGYWLKQLSRLNVSWVPFAAPNSRASDREKGRLMKMKCDYAELMDYQTISCADFISAILIRATGRMLESSHVHKSKSLGLEILFQDKG